ncbi:MAG: HAD family hydrolase [Thermoplasmatota archaeon]
MYAFFDFDNTIIHGDAGPLLGVHMFQRRKARIEDRPHGPVRAVRKTAMWSQVGPFLAWMGVQSALYKARAVRRSTVVRSAYKGFKGVPVAVMDAVLDDFVASEVAPRIYPEVVAEMEQHAAQGRTNVIITTGMERLVRRVLPFLPEGTQVIGCQLEEHEGRFTGRVEDGPLYGQDKANIILAMCKATGTNPKQCYGYTDHFSDHQMLDAVGHGICINPAPRLTRMATQRNWRIMRPEDPR